MGVGGVILRFFNLAVRVLQFLASAVILGVFSYYLAVLAQNDRPIATWLKAVEGLSGAATLYALLASLFTCCLGGIAFFAVVAVVLDVCFVGAMIAIAVMTRDGTQSCDGRVNTPLGTGASDTDIATLDVTYGLSCRLEKVAFAVSIIGIFLFLISILFQILLARHHKREKRFGPSPANGYTYGTRRGFWRRKNKSGPPANLPDDSLPGHPTPADVEFGQTPEKSRFFGNKSAAAPAVPAPGATNGYGNSAYTGNY